MIELLGAAGVQIRQEMQRLLDLVDAGADEHLPALERAVDQHKALVRSAPPRVRARIVLAEALQDDTQRKVMGPEQCADLERRLAVPLVSALRLEPVRPKADRSPTFGATRRRPAYLIYVIGFDRYVKIGITQRDVQHRIAGIQTGCPERLEVYAVMLGDLMLEKALHERFASLRRNGEWFLREGELAAWIEEGCPQ